MVVMRLGGVFVGDKVDKVGSQVQSACVRAFLRRREEKAGWSGGEQQKCGPQRGAEQLI